MAGPPPAGSPAARPATQSSSAPTHPPPLVPGSKTADPRGRAGARAAGPGEIDPYPHRRPPRAPMHRFPFPPRRRLTPSRPHRAGPVGATATTGHARCRACCLARDSRFTVSDSGRGLAATPSTDSSATANNAGGADRDAGRRRPRLRAGRRGRFRGRLAPRRSGRRPAVRAPRGLSGGRRGVRGGWEALRGQRVRQVVESRTRHRRSPGARPGHPGREDDVETLELPASAVLPALPDPAA
jgi:hypothetical protein